MKMLTCVAPADHVEVDIERQPAGRHRRRAHEGAGALEARLLGVEEGQEQRVLEWRRHTARGHVQQHRHSGGVVVGAVVGLAVADAQVVVVSGHDDRWGVGTPPLAAGHDVGAGHGRPAGRREPKGHRETVGHRRFDAQRGEPRHDPRPRLPRPVGANGPAVHAGRGERGNRRKQPTTVLGGRRRRGGDGRSHLARHQTIWRHERCQ